MYANPNVLMFDEAISSLDNIEEEVSHPVYGLFAAKILILIGRQPSTLIKYSKSVYIEKGRLAGDAAYDGLVGIVDDMFSFVKLVDFK